MRPYFKNDLYNFAAQREKEAQEAEENKKKSVEVKKKITTSQDEMKKIDIGEALSFNLLNKNEIIDAQTKEMNDLGQAFKSLNKKQKKENSNIAANGFSKSYKPISTLEIKQSAEELEIGKKKQGNEDKKLIQELRKHSKLTKQKIKQVELQKPEGKQPDNAQQQDAQRVEPKNIQKSNDANKIKQILDSQSEDQSKEKKKKPTKVKMIKKTANYRRLDLKNKYSDKFVGKLAANIKKRNQKFGRYAYKYRSKAQSELAYDSGELYNSYISSLSKALCMDLVLQEDENNQSYSQESILKYEIPTQHTKQNLQKLMKEIFGYQEFRKGQFETIELILKGESAVFVSQTASGKSMTYILSSIVLQGLSIVISPLVSLMLDQLEHLPRDMPAACISSLIDREQRDRIIKLVKQDKIRLLFMTPECLQTDLIYHIKQFPAAQFVCIDEAHSLSELSHNFRTSYLALAEIVKHSFKYASDHPVILCLTATANPQTILNLQNKLSIPNVVQSNQSINRNMFVTVTKEGGNNKYISLNRYLRQKEIRKCKGVLVYARTKKIMFEVYNYLNSDGITPSIYHSGMTNKEKTQTIAKFRDGKIRVVIATIALGMGLDFQNLECIVHINMPKSIENYVQQIGRAGRRQKIAYCHLFLDDNDYFTQRNYIIADELEKQTIYKVLDELKKCSNVDYVHKMRGKRIKKVEENQNLIKNRLSNKDEEKVFEQQGQSQEMGEQVQISKNLFKIAVESKENTTQKRTRLFYIRVSTIVGIAQLREEALLTLLLKIESLQAKSQFGLHILPLSKQLLKLSFFKKNQDELASQSPFFAQLISNCKVVRGTIYVNLIEKCNEMSLLPIDLMSEVYRLGDVYKIKIETDMDVFVWQCCARNGSSDSCAKEEEAHISERVFQELKDERSLDQLIKQINIIQNTSLLKLNTLYSIGLLNAHHNINSFVQQNDIPMSYRRKSEDMVAKLDQYFKQPLADFYNALIDNDEPLIPTKMITLDEQDKIYDSMMLFLRNEINSQEKGQDSQILKKKMYEKHKNGKIISKIFMGISNNEVSWKTYGQHSYWMKYRQKNYQELVDVVKMLMEKWANVQNLH